MNNTPEVITTADAAAMLGITPENLRVYLYRNPDLRPGRRISGDDLLWTEADVQAVAEQRARRNRQKIT